MDYEIQKRYYLKLYLEDEKHGRQRKIWTKKEELNIKKEEKILEANEKKANAKIKIKEKILEKKKARNEKKIEAHLNLADTKIEDAIDDADIAIDALTTEVEFTIANNEELADLVLFNASNILEEILLRTQLQIQVAKNELIANLEKDLGDALDVAVLENNIDELKEKSDVVLTTLKGKVATEKEELNEKYGEE